jgi:Methylase involved in ubiquinone/menaquinone biosynthesis
MDWEEYEKTFYLEPDGILEQENNYFKHIILNLNMYNKKCLDIGCGSGYWIKLFLDRRSIVTGIDIDIKAIKQCQSQYPDCDFIFIEEELPSFAGSSFDFIIANWIFQEIYNHKTFKKYIKEIKRILKPGGNLVIANNIYPDNRVLYESTRLGDIFGNNGNPPFLRFFSNNSLSKIFRSTNFKRNGHKVVGYSFFEIFEKI